MCEEVAESSGCVSSPTSASASDSASEGGVLKGLERLCKKECQDAAHAALAVFLHSLDDDSDHNVVASIVERSLRLLHLLFCSPQPNSLGF